MPRTAVVIYQESEGGVPLIDWLDSLPVKDRIKCAKSMNRLGELGNELRRPEVDYLQDGIYELRIRYRNTNYRILYTFIGKQIALLTHGIVKENRVPPKEIYEALLRKDKWIADPETHTYKEQ
jgi:phage-related protein